MVWVGPEVTSLHLEDIRKYIYEYVDQGLVKLINLVYDKKEICSTKNRVSENAGHEESSCRCAGD